MMGVFTDSHSLSQKSSPTLTKIIVPRLKQYGFLLKPATLNPPTVH